MIALNYFHMNFYIDFMRQHWNRMCQYHKCDRIENEYISKIIEITIAVQVANSDYRLLIIGNIFNFQKKWTYSTFYTKRFTGFIETI